jgi:putative membrane protein
VPAELLRLPWLDWLEPNILLPIAAMAFAYYLVADGPLRASGGDDPADRGRGWMAYAAFAVLYLSFGGPLDVLADASSFAAHMLQHTLGTMVAAPLLVAGVPVRLWRRVVRAPVLGPLMRQLVRPVPAILVFNALLGVSILPAVYDLVEQNDLVHLAEHALLVATAVLMWWPVLSRVPELPRLHPGLRMLYLFADGMPMIFTMTFPTLSSQPMYPYYAHAPELFGMSQVVEQQLGGALMITLMHIAYGIAFIVAFFDFKNAADQSRIDPVLVAVRPDGTAGARRLSGAAGSGA